MRSLLGTGQAPRPCGPRGAGEPQQLRDAHHGWEAEGTPAAPTTTRYAPPHKRPNTEAERGLGLGQHHGAPIRGRGARVVENWDPPP